MKNIKKLAVVCAMAQCLALSVAYVVPAAEAATYSSTDNQSARFGDEYTWYYKKEKENSTRGFTTILSDVGNLTGFLLKICNDLH